MIRFAFQRFYVVLGLMFQVARTMWEVATFVALHLRREDQDQDVPFILCGDFNSTPESPVYQLCRDGYLNDRMLNRLQKIQNIKFPSSEAVRFA